MELQTYLSKKYSALGVASSSTAFTTPHNTLQTVRMGALNPQ